MQDTIDTPLGPLRIDHPPGTFAPTPATRVMVRAITGGSMALAGYGLDWGCGTGALTIAAARLPAVIEVVGLDISADDVGAARLNAMANGVEEKTRFLIADGYRPLEPHGLDVVHALRGRVAFITANPPASQDDDGFSFRRLVFRGAGGFLAPGGVVLVQALSAYGDTRVQQLAQDTPGFVYDGVVESTSAVRLALGRGTLLRQLQDYVAEEERGGLPYRFEDPAGRVMDAVAALRRYEASGTEPLARWQCHRFLWQTS